MNEKQECFDAACCKHVRFQTERAAELRNAKIGEPWSPLNRLKGANLEAFHYWRLAQQTLGA